MGSKKADCEEELSFVLRVLFEQPKRFRGADAVGLLLIGAVRGQPAQRAAEVAGPQAENRGFVIYVATAGVDGVIP